MAECSNSLPACKRHKFSGPPPAPQSQSHRINNRRLEPPCEKNTTNPPCQRANIIRNPTTRHRDLYIYCILDRKKGQARRVIVIVVTTNKTPPLSLSLFFVDIPSTRNTIIISTKTKTPSLIASNGKPSASATHLQRPYATGGSSGLQ